ncbi:MAG: TolB family protein [Planctomycetota bacterium]
MRTQRVFLIGTVTCIVAGYCAVPAFAQGPLDCSNALASVSSAGVPADADSNSPSFSGDGRFLVFQSAATNLVDDDTNGVIDVYLRDRALGTTTRVSHALDGGDPNDACLNPTISESGRYIVFESEASNLVASDLNPKADIFLFDRLTNVTKLVSQSSTGVQANNWCYRASIAGDGKSVVFISRADNLATGELNGTGADVYVRNLVNNTTQRVSVSSSGIAGNFPSERATISRDGRYVAFESVATNLQSGLPPPVGPSRVYLRDRQLNTTKLISKSTSNGFANGPAWGPVISRNGNVVVYESSATNLILEDENEQIDVFLWDGPTGGTELVSQHSNGNPARNGPSGGACPSPDGLWVIFWSHADTLVPQDENNAPDVFLRNRPQSSTSRASLNFEDAQANAGSLLTTNNGLVSQNLLYVFESRATDLLHTVEGEDGNGGEGPPVDDTWRIYVRDCLADPVAFCFGTAKACPCGNGSEGATTGCGNSANAAGAQLVQAGFPSTGADTVTLRASGTPPFAAVLFFQGDDYVNDQLGEPFGDGLRCLGGNLRRLGLRQANGGVSELGYGLADFPISVLGGLTSVSITLHYQAMYRDVTDFCSPSTINYSHGLSILWLP